jgi:hypothetical protein
MYRMTVLGISGKIFRIRLFFLKKIVPLDGIGDFRQRFSIQLFCQKRQAMAAGGWDAPGGMFPTTALWGC